MIKYETIISNFEDKTTLYNWLRKVEEALKHASATNFVVNKKGNATLSFSITFADGTTLESGDIVLQQGESVDDARIASGILQLHLTNGTWLTAGNIKPVSRFDISENQHLIVTYQDGTSQDLGAIFQGNVTISGTLTGQSATFTGNLNLGGNASISGNVGASKITGTEILETMSGYSFETFSSGNVTLEDAYVSCVKTGNKITFVIAGKITRTGAVSAFEMGRFAIPASLGDKLYPIDASGNLGYTSLGMFEDYETSINIPVVFKKYNNERVGFILWLNTLTANTPYYFRIEQTYLLSDNMAS